MKTFRKLLDGKPSSALQAMVDGLREQSKREDFKIDMASFGHEESGVCFGCAATCTIQEVKKTNLTAEHIDIVDLRSQKLNVDYEDLSDFEDAINDAREGHLDYLFEYMKIKNSHNKSFDERFHLTTSNWKEQLPEVEKLIQELKEIDL